MILNYSRLQVPVGPRLITPYPTLPAFVYVDASGWPSAERVWGGLIALGEEENRAVSRYMDDLRLRNQHLLRDSGELKGGDVYDDEINHAAELLKGHAILFWANRYASTTTKEIAQYRRGFVEFVKGTRANPSHKSRESIQSRLKAMGIYLDRLKEMNAHKFFCMVMHLQRLFDELSRHRIGPKLASVTLVVDRENFPKVEHCAWCFKAWVASGLQSIGMAHSLTGDALFEQADEGAVMVDVNGDSRGIDGIQFVDILAQGTLRRLPPFTST